MIELTRLNGKKFTMNALYIETVESFPDTTITLTTGTKMIVRETEEVVRELATRFFRDVQLLSNLQLRGDKHEE